MDSENLSSCLSSAPTPAGLLSSAIKEIEPVYGWKGTAIKQDNM